MPKIELVCAQCGSVFQKDIKDYRIAVNKGKDKFFCNLQCCGMYKRNRKFTHSDEVQKYSWDENVLQADMEAK